jgi:hypothetical protein
MKILKLIDRFAGHWIDYRTRRNAQKIGLYDKLNDMSVDGFKAQNGNIEMVLKHPDICLVASGFAAILSESNAENYVQFDMMPRADHAIKPIRVTIQWADGLSPAVKAARLEKELDELKQNINNKERT